MDGVPISRDNWTKVRQLFYSDRSAALDALAERVLAAHAAHIVDTQDDQAIRLIGAAIYARFHRLPQPSRSLLLGPDGFIARQLGSPVMGTLGRRRLVQLLEIVSQKESLLTSAEAEWALEETLDALQITPVGGPHWARLQASGLAALLQLSVQLEAPCLLPFFPSLIGLLKTVVWAGISRISIELPCIVETRHRIGPPKAGPSIISTAQLATVKEQRKARPKKATREAAKARLEASESSGPGESTDDEGGPRLSLDSGDSAVAVRRAAQKLLCWLAWKMDGLGLRGERKHGAVSRLPEAGELERYWLDLFPETGPSPFGAVGDASFAHLLIRDPVDEMRIATARAVAAWVSLSPNTIASATQGPSSFTSFGQVVAGSIGEIYSVLQRRIPVESDFNAMAQELKALNALVAVLPFTRLGWDEQRRHSAFHLLKTMLGRNIGPNATAPALTCVRTLVGRPGSGPWDGENLRSLWTLSRDFSRPPHQLPVPTSRLLLPNVRGDCVMKVRLEAVALSARLLDTHRLRKEAWLEEDVARTAVVQLCDPAHPPDFQFYALRLLRALLTSAREEKTMELWLFGIKSTALSRLSSFAELGKPLMNDISQTFCIATPEVLANADVVSLISKSIPSLIAAMKAGNHPAIPLLLRFYPSHPQLDTRIQIGHAIVNGIGNSFYPFHESLLRRLEAAISSSSPESREDWSRLADGIMRALEATSRTADAKELAFTLSLAAAALSFPIQDPAPVLALLSIAADQAQPDTQVSELSLKLTTALVTRGGDSARLLAGNLLLPKLLPSLRTVPGPIALRRLKQLRFLCHPKLPKGVVELLVGECVELLASSEGEPERLSLSLALWGLSVVGCDASRDALARLLPTLPFRLEELVRVELFSPSAEGLGVGEYFALAAAFAALDSPEAAEIHKALQDAMATAP